MSSRPFSGGDCRTLNCRCRAGAEGIPVQGGQTVVGKVLCCPLWAEMEDRIMPGGDRTGPEGRGPMTGRRAGLCTGNRRPGFAGRGYPPHHNMGGGNFPRSGSGCPLPSGERRSIKKENVMPRGDGTGPPSGGQGKGVGRTGRGLGPEGDCVCPKCGKVAPHGRGVPCSSMKCPDCDANMTRK